MRAVSSHWSAVNLVIADDVAHAVGKNFCAAAGKRIDAGGFQLLQRLADRELGALRQVRDLDHGEGFEMNLRKALLETREIRSRKY